MTIQTFCLNTSTSLRRLPRTLSYTEPFHHFLRRVRPQKSKRILEQRHMAKPISIFITLPCYVIAGPVSQKSRSSMYIGPITAAPVNVVRDAKARQVIYEAGKGERKLKCGWLGEGTEAAWTKIKEGESKGTVNLVAIDTCEMRRLATRGSF